MKEDNVTLGIKTGSLAWAIELPPTLLTTRPSTAPPRSSLVALATNEAAPNGPYEQKETAAAITTTMAPTSAETVMPNASPELEPTDNLLNDDNKTMMAAETTPNAHAAADNDDMRVNQLSREEEESIELARQLMAEEAMASYHHHVESLRLASENGEMSPEDYAIWQIAMQEEEREEVEQEEAANELSYDRLLELAERIGDVRTERWTMVAEKEIEKLHVCTFDPSLLMNLQSADDSLHKCLVCQCEYETDETLRRLPCSHYFHQSCVDLWLKSKDFCPYCRKSIVS